DRLSHPLLLFGPIRPPAHGGERLADEVLVSQRRRPERAVDLADDAVRRQHADEDEDAIEDSSDNVASTFVTRPCGTRAVPQARDQSPESLHRSNAPGLDPDVRERRRISRSGLA